MVPAGKRPLLVTPNDVRFRAQRVWSHGDEHGFMKAIENAFQAVADRFVRNTGPLGAADSEAVTRMHCLWGVRYEFRDAPSDPLKLQRVPPDPGYSKDLEEKAEAVGATVVRNDATISRRSFYGLQMLRIVEYRSQQGSRDYWFTVEFPEGNLPVPDRPMAGYMPLTPTHAFLLVNNRHLGEHALVAAVKGHAKEFYFTRP